MDNIIYNTIPYTVKRKETLTSIARQLGTSVQAIIKANPEIRNPDMIFTGQEIRVPIPGYQIPEMPEMEEEVSPFASPMSQYSHPMNTGPSDEQIVQQLLMGGMAGAAPMAAIAGPGALAAAGRVLTSLPRMTQAGRVVSPAAKGAVDWPGATRAMSNVRPYPPTGGMPASRAAARGILNQRSLRSGGSLTRGMPPGPPVPPSMLSEMPPGPPIPPSMLNGMPHGPTPGPNAGILEMLRNL